MTNEEIQQLIEEIAEVNRGIAEVLADYAAWEWGAWMGDGGDYRLC